MKKIVLAILSIAVIFAAFFVFYEDPNIVNFQSLFPENSTPTPTLSVTSAPTPDSTNTPTSTPSLTSSPALSPTSYGELEDYTLSLINSDRQQNGLQNVTLSNIDSGQLHANNMLKNRYVSHWDMNGYKPYMRYTLAGGQGAVAENIAWEGETGNAVGIDVKAAIKDMEYGMMYNDSASNWGHRDNILNPLHNEINIGVAYDNHNVYLVEDFEDNYVQWSTLSSSGSQMQMSGTVTQTNLTLSQVAIYYDNVSNLTVQQLSSSPYQGSYDSGTSVGIVVPPGWNAQQGTTITAQTWSQNGQKFDITFSLSSAFAQDGIGVYTLYLWTDSNSYLTTYSIWDTGS